MINIRLKSKDIKTLFSKKFKGSITVESAFSFTLTAFILFLMLGPLLIIKTSSDIIVKLNDASKYRCLYELIASKMNSFECFDRIEKYASENEKIFELKNKIIDFMTYEIVDGAVNNSYGESEREYKNIDYIYNFKDKVFDEEKGIVKYDYVIKFKLPYNVLHIDGIYKRFVNYRRAFIGADENRFEIEKDDKEYVYIAKNSKYSNRYHNSLECTYFDKTVFEFKYIDRETERNEDGDKLSKCDFCFKDVKPKNTMVCYKTSFGDKYHTTATCAVMTGIAIKISVEEAKERNLELCTRCINRRE